MSERVPAPVAMATAQQQSARTCRKLVVLPPVGELVHRAVIEQPPASLGYARSCLSAIVIAKIPQVTLEISERHGRALPLQGWALTGGPKSLISWLTGLAASAYPACADPVARAGRTRDLTELGRTGCREVSWARRGHC